MKTKILTASAVILALAACGGEREADDGAAMDNMMADAGNGMIADNAAIPAATMANSGQEYAAMVAASDLYEIESGRLAREKTQDAEIRDLAQMIVTDHEKSTADLLTAAQQAQPAITVTPEMNAEQQSMMQALRSANGDRFDQEYLRQQVAAHEKALALVRHFAQNGDVEGLRQHASTVSGPIQRHLEQARTLSQR